MYLAVSDLQRPVRCRSGIAAQLSDHAPTCEPYIPRDGLRYHMATDAPGRSDDEQSAAIDHGWISVRESIRQWPPCHSSVSWIDKPSPESDCGADPAFGAGADAR